MWGSVKQMSSVLKIVEYKLSSYIHYNCVADLLETPERGAKGQNLSKTNRQKKSGTLLPKEVVVFQH